MEEKETNEVVETTSTETTESSPVSQSDDGTIKVNLSE